MTTYIETARALPVPSDEQTRDFAVYVTGAHSWYKHLPILPLSPFVFFLDPNAGRSMVHVLDDGVAFVDNRGNRSIHCGDDDLSAIAMREPHERLEPDSI